MMEKIVIVVVSVLASSSAGWFDTYPQPEWRDLSVTFGSFSRLPRKAEDAISSGWILDKPCSGNNPYFGNRYILDGDVSTMLLFDKQGYIAGIQTKIPKTDEYPDAKIRKFFIEEDGAMVITAYFVQDPSTICTTGRTAQQFQEEGTGTALHIQSGSNPRTDLMTIPMLQSDMAGTQWTEGQCFWGMGKHYWYNVRRDMDCKEFYPVFAMYNNGKLNSFGWAFYVHFSSSRYEHPSNTNLEFFMKPVPTCLTSGAFNGFSTIHIYLDRRPYFNFC
ncbi:uncharacterized protein LOC106172134 [Lingula anatina]|uniref:Uncharacterized protein LOC106172134 n=1 Tax=Lingula anatina TaxID=7574 RepID=A0A1S3JDE4_LINAN|nr:uncharacterized protein LOC106172134 [Lingula anatina]|eukprot:XP_013408191.1 uncharacterized protein LOC106172134 [Lingula anatina]